MLFTFSCQKQARTQRGCGWSLCFILFWMNSVAWRHSALQLHHRGGQPAQHPLIFMPELEVEWTPLIRRDLSLAMHDAWLQTQSAYNGFLLQDRTRVYPPIGKDQRATHTASRQKVMQVIGDEEGCMKREGVRGFTGS